ncbi:hypothetical protein [Cyclobacterium qasimii]|uniref:DUF4221 domain-containing protein n=3 Tax=Cyclobacterium qasimii TaxID=1350429 RepID=A0A512CDV4_9BACT|nr:hypothetical protein [Cyclobacterium qasimii]GEO22381.1 hypothetical protein CQA01_29150 [Cyclobacterium qasimii]
MIKVRNILILLLVSVYACTDGTKTSNSSADSNEWKLVILDSIQVDYLTEVREGIFSNGIGLIKTSSNNGLIKFDSLGTILVNKEFPQEGPESVMFLETLIEHKGEYFGTTSFSDMYHFDANLNIKERLKMPFMGEARGGAYNRRNIAVWNEKILLWYPGRNGISPYIDHFYRDYPFLELYDLKTKTSKPVVRTPKTSQYSSDDFFDRPDINFIIENDSLYLTFSNEPLIHVYAMGDSILWKRSIPMNPSDFKLIPGQKTPVTYQEKIKMYEAGIRGIYSDQEHVIVSYHGGIDGDTFVNNDLMERENSPRYPEFLKNYLKIYRHGQGWSNELIIPSKIKIILNIESADKPFYALRNDDFIGEEQDYLTFYKLELMRK